MISHSDWAVGEIVHKKLLAAGGFVWDLRRWGEDKITVHMNRGRVMDASLRDEIKRHGRELKAYVFAKNDAEAERARLREWIAKGVEFRGTVRSGGPRVGSSLDPSPSPSEPRRTSTGISHG